MFLTIFSIHVFLTFSISYFENQLVEMTKVLQQLFLSLIPLIDFKMNKLKLTNTIFYLILLIYTIFES